MAALETCAWLPKVPCRRSRDPGSCATAAAAACATGEAAGAATRGAWEAEVIEWETREEEFQTQLSSL